MFDFPKTQKKLLLLYISVKCKYCLLQCTFLPVFKVYQPHQSLQVAALAPLGKLCRNAQKQPADNIKDVQFSDVFQVLRDHLHRTQIQSVLPQWFPLEGFSCKLVCEASSSCDTTGSTGCSKKLATQKTVRVATKPPCRRPASTSLQ